MFLLLYTLAMRKFGFFKFNKFYNKICRVVAFGFGTHDLGANRFMASQFCQ